MLNDNANVRKWLPWAREPFKSRDGARGAMTRAHLVWASRLCSSISMKVSDSLSFFLNAIFGNTWNAETAALITGTNTRVMWERQVRDTWGAAWARRQNGGRLKKIRSSLALVFFLPCLLRPRPNYTSLLGPRTIKSTVFLIFKCCLNFLSRVDFYWKTFLSVEASLAFPAFVSFYNSLRRLVQLRGVNRWRIHPQAWNKYIESMRLIRYGEECFGVVFCPVLWTKCYTSEKINNKMYWRMMCEWQVGPPPVSCSFCCCILKRMVDKLTINAFYGYKIVLKSAWGKYGRLHKCTVVNCKLELIRGCTSTRVNKCWRFFFPTDEPFFFSGDHNDPIRVFKQTTWHSAPWTKRVTTRFDPAATQSRGSCISVVQNKSTLSTCLGLSGNPLPPQLSKKYMILYAVIMRNFLAIMT